MANHTVNYSMAVWHAVHEVAPFAFRVLDEVKVYVTTARSLGCEWKEALDEKYRGEDIAEMQGGRSENWRYFKEARGADCLLIYILLSRAKVHAMSKGSKTMDSPPTSSIAFLDQAGNNIDGPSEWATAPVEVRVRTQDWEMVRLIRQNNEELPLSLSRLGRRDTWIIATWPPSGTGHYRLALYIGDTKAEERTITISPRKISTVAYAQLLEDLEMRLPAAIASAL